MLLKTGCKDTKKNAVVQEKSKKNVVGNRISETVFRKSHCDFAICADGICTIEAFKPA